jgi:hypothetical protein
MAEPLDQTSSGSIPEHDPLLDELDLMTHQEAAVRFYEQVEELRAEIAVLRSSDPSAASLIAEKEARIDDLQATARRIATRRTPFD